MRKYKKKDGILKQGYFDTAVTNSMMDFQGHLFPFFFNFDNFLIGFMPLRDVKEKA